MITLEDVLSPPNLENAMHDILLKNDSCGIDGIWISQFVEYWNINGSNILDLIKRECYTPSIIQHIEILTKSGKKRTISKYATTDRFLLRAITQALHVVIEQDFTQHSYAYRDGYGVTSATQKAAYYIQSGNS